MLVFHIVLTTVFNAATLLDNGIIVIGADGVHRGLVDVEKHTQLTGWSRTIESLVSLAHRLVLVLAYSELWVLDIGIGVPAREHHRDAMLLLLDADGILLGFTEQRIDSCLVTAFICLQS